MVNDKLGKLFSVKSLVTFLFIFFVFSLHSMKVKRVSASAGGVTDQPPGGVGQGGVSSSLLTHYTEVLMVKSLFLAVAL